MRVLLFSIVLLSLPTLVPGQAEQTDAEATVRQVWKHLSQGAYTSTDVKELGWLGDSSAVALTKILGGKILDTNDIESVLLTIKLSYADPRIVKTDSDRQPRTTLLLLHYLNLATNDTRLKEKIGNTEEFVSEQYLRSMRGARSPNTDPTR